MLLNSPAAAAAVPIVNENINQDVAINALADDIVDAPEENEDINPYMNHPNPILMQWLPMRLRMEVGILFYSIIPIALHQNTLQ